MSHKREEGNIWGQYKVMNEVHSPGEQIASGQIEQELPGGTVDPIDNLYDTVINVIGLDPNNHTDVEKITEIQSLFAAFKKGQPLTVDRAPGPDLGL